MFNFQKFDRVRSAKFLGEFNCVPLPNPMEVNRTIGVRLGSITERSIDYAGWKAPLPQGTLTILFLFIWQRIGCCGKFWLWATLKPLYPTTIKGNLLYIHVQWWREKELQYCSKPNTCPMDGNCHVQNNLCQAEVTTPTSKETYIGLYDTSFKKVNYRLWARPLISPQL